MLALTWAVHIADGVLDWPLLLAGFAVAAALAGVASWRVREEEVPRIALLTAAFFVASSIHVKLGPTSVHLLLNGLVGVVLGRRAPLAILIGVILQALLIPHGGLTTVGVNAAVQMLPALAAGVLFPWLLARMKGRPWRRSALVALSALLWGGLVAFTVMALATNPWREVVRVSAEAGVVVSLGQLRPAVTVLLHPVTWAVLSAFAVGCVWAERRLENAPEFPAGAFLGAFAVVATTMLAGVVLLADGADRWGTFVSAVFLAHLPLALVEGLILGVTVGFLARVKPEMLPPAVLETGGVKQPVCTTAGLALAALLLFGQHAQAHRLEAEVKKVDVQKKQVTVESWYETGDPPEKATAKVVREDGSVVTEGPLDARGAFVFSYDNAEPLRVSITAPGGHRATLRLTAKELGAVEESPSPRVEPEPRSRGRDLLLGLTFLLALAAFALSWRNARRLQTMARG